MPKRKDKRYLGKLLQQSLTQRTRSSSATTTRHHVTASGTTTEEVPRKRISNTEKQVIVESLLDAPVKEGAEGVTADGLEDPANMVHDPDTLLEEQTQTRRLLEGFLKIFPQLEESLMAHYANPFAHEGCRCGSGQPRLVQCRECTPYTPTCKSCFMRLHRHMRWHWASVWDPDKGSYSNIDYSEVLPDSADAVLHLGHPLDEASCSMNDAPQALAVVHSNGVHNTKVRFCCCSGTDRAIQLTHAGLFPGSSTYPQTAFTFSLLKEFQHHTRQSRCSSFDWIVALRRMTDDVLPHKVPDPYKSFLRVTRIWENLTTRANVGFTQNLNSFLPNRPSNAIILYCPACPEPGINMFNGWETTPAELQHIITLFLAMDGNHRSNRFTKNTDPKDLSLWEGVAYGYFPSTKAYSDYLNKIPVTKEKSVCSFINAVNMQDRKKFRGNAETGMIAYLCSHGIVDSANDMYLGERFAYSDYGLAHALRMRRVQDLPITVAYDAACSYAVNVRSRFSEHIPDLHDVISRTRFVIDSLHVHDHIDKCMYTYSTAYQDNTGHFHGIGVEQFWSVQNHSGPKTSQMNPGHRTDCITSDIGDWNWKKTVRLPDSLAEGLIHACSMYTKKREWLRRLSIVNEDKIKDWFRMDRRPIIKANGEIESVYYNSASVDLSFESVYQRLLKADNNTMSVSVSQVIFFLAEGLSIQAKQASIKLLVEEDTKHPLASTKRDIQKVREAVTTRLDRWRNLQAIHMSSVEDYVISQSPRLVEEENLFLPSNFPVDERDRLGISSLVHDEGLLREAQAHECLLQLRLTLKIISVLHLKRRTNVVGQRRATRARSRISTMEAVRDHYLLVYNTTRAGLVSLAVLHPDDERLPHLSPNDLIRKSTIAKRQLGDTYHADGKFWGLKPWDWSNMIGTSSNQEPMQVEQGPLAEPGKEGNSSAAPGAGDSSSGRAWRPNLGMSEVDMEKWEKIEDRVQWHRAFADMVRWLEEFELKHVEFVRCIASFHATASAWSAVAAKESREGYAAFARIRADIYLRLRDHAEELFRKNAEPRLHGSREELIRALKSLRERELGWLWKMAGVGMETETETAPSELEVGSRAEKRTRQGSEIGMGGSRFMEDADADGERAITQ